MDFIMQSKVNCLNIPMILKAQKIALVEKLNEISSSNRNLPSSRLLTMLFLGCQDLSMDAVADSEIETHDGSTYVCANYAPFSRFHHTLNMSNRMCKFTTYLAPQDVCSEIRIDVDVQRCFVSLRKVNGILLSVWQDRVRAAMGFTAGCNIRGGAKVKHERIIRRADFRDGW